MTAPRALIIGGSVGGLFAGCLLRRQGWDVTIFERATGDLAGRGAGLGISAELLAVMRRIGIRLDPSLGAMQRGFFWLGADGAIRSAVEREMVSSAWDRIYRPLRDAFPSAQYRTGTTLARVEIVPRKVIAVFADGAREEGDLLVGADGVFSTLRRQLMPEIEPRYAGYVAWRGVVEESDLPPGFDQRLLQGIAFSFPEGELALSMPIPGREEDVRPGHRRYYVIWYRPVDALEELPALLTDETGRHHGLTIPPPLIRPHFVAALREAARARLAPQLAEVVARVKQPLLQPIIDMESPRLVFGRVALLGDSAFIARPHVAAGATKAAIDAASLADALADCDDIDAALARYQAQSLAFGRALVGYSRYLGAYLEAQLEPPERRDHTALSRDPEQHMREYGAPHLVHAPEMADLAADGTL